MRSKALVILVCFLIAGVMAPANPNAIASVQANDWSGESGDGANTYFAPVSLPANLVLKHNPVVKGHRPLAVMNGRLYALDPQETNKLYAVDLAANTVMWEFTGESAQDPIHELVAANGSIYVRSANHLYALEDAGSRFAIKWSRNPAGGRMTYDESRLYVLNGNSYVTAVDAKTGAEIWSYSPGPSRQITGKMVTGGGKLFFVAKDNKEMKTQLYALDASTSEVQWTWPVYGDTSGNPVFKGNKVYLDVTSGTMSNRSVTVQAIDAATGNTLWKQDVKGEFGKVDNKLSVNDDSVFTVTSNGYLVALNKDTGAERWRVWFGERVDGGRTVESSGGATVVTKDKVFLENNRKIKIIDANTGSLLRDIQLGFDSSYQPLAIGANLLFISDGNRLITYAPVDQPAPAKVGKTTANSNLRKGPGTQHEVIRVVPAGSTVSIVGESGDWYQVRYTNSGMTYTGYIAKFLVDVQQPAPAKVGKTTANSNLRKGPGTQHEVIRVVPAGSTVSIVGESGDWYQVRYTNSGVTYTGYIAKFLVDVQQPAPTKVGKTTANSNLRKGPGTQHEVIRVVPAGSTVSIVGESDDWYQVRYTGSGVTYTGYIAKFLVSVESK